MIDTRELHMPQLHTVSVVNVGVLIPQSVSLSEVPEGID